MNNISVLVMNMHYESHKHVHTVHSDMHVLPTHAHQRPPSHLPSTSRPTLTLRQTHTEKTNVPFVAKVRGGTEHLFKPWKPSWMPAGTRHDPVCLDLNPPGWLLCSPNPFILFYCDIFWIICENVCTRDCASGVSWMQDSLTWRTRGVYRICRQWEG